MRLTRQLLLGTVALIAVLILAIVTLAGGRLHDRLTERQREELLREARLVAASWRLGVNADSLANVAGGALGYRVTLIAESGEAVGDSEFDGVALQSLGNMANRTEIGRARAGKVGNAVALRPVDGEAAMYVALRHPLGYVRLAVGTERVAAIVSGAQRDVLVAGAFAFLGALLLAWLFARSVSRPVVELRDVAGAIASGDLTARPAIAAPGEVGELAAALHQMAEQLSRRLAALREEDALLTALVESLNEGVLAMSPRGHVVRVNDRALDFLRLNELPPFSTERLPRNATLRATIDAAMAGTPTEPTELQLFGRTLVVTARPLESGGAVVALFDLTAIRRLELIRSDFVANVSHELKTPLTVVRGFAETLLDPRLAPDDRRRFSDAIVTNAGRMQRIVDDLLDLSRIESGGWVPDPGWAGIAGIVDDAFSAARAAVAAKGLTLESTIGPELVFADITALRQVMGNLIDNAVRYTVSGSVTVSVRRAEGVVTISVRDTGIGIAAEHLPRIFERFYRVDRARARSDGGTGLGLAIVKHLVEAHGGRVGAQSAPGHGTVISVSFPDPPGSRPEGDA